MTEDSQEGIDGLTRLPNRSTLETEIRNTFNEGMLKVSKGEDCTHSVIMFDIDYFKSINDLYSHSQGDAVLEIVGYLLGQYNENNNIFCLLGRWGGEEFLMVIPYDTKRVAKYVADEVKDLVANHDFPDINKKGQSLKERITLSMGVKYVDLSELIRAGIDNSQIEQVKDNAVGNANVALDYAKFMGRNRVEEFCDIIEREIQNLEKVRGFYFENSFKKPSELRGLLKDGYLERNPQVKNKIKKHFYIIRTEINQRDTRTQAVFADNLYRQFGLSMDEQFKKEFVEFIKRYSNPG